MATYAIGDVQGCWLTLKALLRRISFDQRRDRLWLTGDLVNRGPRSLDVLRWARDMGDRIVTVLGNHDLHLVGVALGVRKRKKGDTLEAILKAKDCDELVRWLARRPLFHRQGRYVLVHAGLPPAWGLGRTQALAREAEAVLRRSPRRALAAYSLRGVERWDGRGRRGERLAQTLQALTLLRTLHPDGTPCRGFSGAPGDAPSGCSPWFDDRPRGTTVIFGHWAALGLRMTPGILALDTGCVWGGPLTAVRLKDRALFQQRCLDTISR